MSIQIQIIRRRGRPPMPNMNRDKTTGRSRGEAVESIIAIGLGQRLKSGISYEDAVVRDSRTMQVIGSNQDAGHVLGRLRMSDIGGISTIQYDIGMSYFEAVNEFARVMGYALESPKSPGFELVSRGLPCAPETSEKTILFIRNRYDECQSALARAGFETKQGTAVAKITNAVCLDRIDYETIRKDWNAQGNLRAGLNAVGRVLR